MHRPGDSQLLAQLIKHDKEYATALSSLVGASAASRDALSGYAAASPQHVASSIAVLVKSLAAADDALTTYRDAFEDWRQQLSALKELQDEVQVVLRDRQILISRVIKVSKPARTSVVGSSSSSFSSHDSKVTQAQAELRACETYLADKERDTDKAWTHAMRDGLRARAAALVQLGVTYADRGRHALQLLDGRTNGNNNYNNIYNKPLPNPDTHSRSSSIDIPFPLPRNVAHLSLPPSSTPIPAHLSLPPSSLTNGHMSDGGVPFPNHPLPPPPGSDNDSLTPSQSVSQIDGLPASGDLSRSSSLTKRGGVSGLPMSIPGPIFPTAHHPYSHPGAPRTSIIVEEPDQLDYGKYGAAEAGGSSDEEEAIDPSTIRVVENNPAKRQSIISLRRQPEDKQPSSVTSQNRSQRGTLTRRHPRSEDSGSPLHRQQFPSLTPPSLGRIPSSSSRGSLEDGGKRRRASSFTSSFLGGIANMFGSRKQSASPVRDHGSWSSRTDANLRKSGVSRREGSSDDDRSRWTSVGNTLSRNDSLRSRKGSLRSLGGDKSDEPTKIYIRANKASAGGFAFARPLSTASTKEPRSSSNVGPSTAASSQRRSESSNTSSLRHTRPLDVRGPSLMALVETAAGSEDTKNPTTARTARQGSVQVVSSSVPVPRPEKHASVPVLPARRTSSPEPERGLHKPVTREAEMAMGPLRSALRNRSPSPLSGSLEDVPASRSYAGYDIPPLQDVPTPQASPPPPPPAVLPADPPPSSSRYGQAATSIPRNATGKPAPLVATADDSESDGASISSYATGRETLLGDPVPQDERVPSPPPRIPSPPIALSSPPLPDLPISPLPSSVQALRYTNANPATSSSSTISLHSSTPPGSVGVVDGSARAGATINSVSTAGTGTTATRRKSVRMVLPADFVGTPTTPVTDNTEVSYNGIQHHDRGRPQQSRSYMDPPSSHRPSVQGAWTSRNGASTTTKDAWADSSDEDFEGDYARARRALATADRNAEGAAGIGSTKRRKTRTRKP